MKAIIINEAVVDKIKTCAMDANEAIEAVYGEELKERRETDKSIKNLSNMQVAMKDVGFNRRSKNVGEFMNAATTTQGNGSGNLLFPVWTDTRVREAIESMNLMQYAVAGTPIPVEGGVLQAFSIDPFSGKNKAQLKKARVAEGADIPTSRIVGSEVFVTLYKVASAVQTTYEAIRRMKIPLYAKTLDFLARDVVHQQLGWVVDTLQKDATSLLTTATENVITNSELTRAVYDYYLKNNIAPTTLIVGEEMGMGIAEMSFNSNMSFGANEKLKLNIPQLGEVSLTILLADVPKVGSKNVALLYNNLETIDKYVEVGSMISETQTNIINQTNFITASENVGFGIFLKGSNMLITSK